MILGIWIVKNIILIHVIGDANKIGNAQDAINDAYEIAKKI